MNANTPDLDIDHTIDRALATLRDAHPRSGFKTRVLGSLEHRAATPQPARLHLSAHLALWSATAAAILAIVSMAVLHQQRTAPAEFVRAPQTHASNADVSAQLQAPTAVTKRRPEQSRVRRGAFVFATPQPAHDITTPIGADAQAVADLHAPSQPAPPLPLTPQEKLFLRMLRYGNATQLAELNPVVRAQQDAAETADFKNFFPDPPPIHQPGDNE
ncbi:MAG TPA: hypothetical protein VGM11_13365 [Acidobacteriaceae bacterium]|jgi:hypothetical protein